MGLSTHILDTSRGRPVMGVALALWKQQGAQWVECGRGVTDTDGRCRTLLGDEVLTEAVYRLQFEVAAYFREQGLSSLYPFVEITFEITKPEEHHHIPLLLTANGYTTYRGS